MDRVNAGGGASNTPPKTQQHLDWLELTFPILRDKIPQMYPESWELKTVPDKPKNGYKVCNRFRDGRLEMFHPDEPRMGVHVVFDATTLAGVKETDEELVRHFIEMGATITRLDCAVDVFDYTLDFDELWGCAERGEYKCRLRDEPQRDMKAKGTGDTIYFGRMKSSACTRIYDKAAQQKVKATWVRVETMFRHGRANNAAKAVARGVECQDLILGHVNLPQFRWWVDVLTGKPAKTRLARVDGNKRYEWLMKSVAPTLAKEIFLHGDRVYDDFKSRVVEELYKLEKFSTE